MLVVDALRDLAPWGWDEAWASAFAALAPAPLAPAAAVGTAPAGLAPAALVPARVVSQHRGRWMIVAASGESAAVLTGRFRHDAAEGDLPAVGDWVGCLAPERDREARIDAILPRRSAFVRRVPGTHAGRQVIAANIDTILVATSLNAELKERRLERYVAMGRESGAEPVVVLTKADLSADPSGHIVRLGRDLGVRVVAVSARTGSGLDGLDAWLRPGRTIALVGSSGVGKSTLLNRLAGRELMATREIRLDDARGRHATTHRELFRLSGGALLVDTPGMRELGLWDAADGVDRAFEEILELATHCRFADCRHEREPDCAVRAAIAAGRLDERRLRGYRRLSSELADQPSPAQLRTAQRRFGRVVRDAAAASIARKQYRG